MENTMHNVTIKTLLFVISLTGGLGPCGVATAGGRGTAVLPSPVIMKTAVDVKANILIISGRNFGSDAAHRDPGRPDVGR